MMTLSGSSFLLLIYGLPPDSLLRQEFFTDNLKKIAYPKGGTEEFVSGLTTGIYAFLSRIDFSPHKGQILIVFWVNGHYGFLELLKII